MIGEYDGTIRDVVDKDICVGCGACVVAADGPISLNLLDRGYFQADLGDATEAEIQRASAVCPFSDLSRNESEIASDLFGDIATEDARVGRYRGIYAGRVNVSDQASVMATSSGGMTSWLVTRLLDSGAVDGVIHVGSGGREAGRTSGELFRYEVVEDVGEVMAGRKSRYYPVTFAEVFRAVRGNKKRYAFVGVPCQVRAARLVTEQDPVLAGQLKYFVGLVCGHLKSSAYAESLAWQLGVPPGQLEAVDFRIKDPHGTAKSYKFGARAVGDAEYRTSHMGPLVGGRWGHAVFQLGACDFCDDVFAETADIVLGDAWLPEFEADWRGTNVVVTRDASLDAIIQDGMASGDLDGRPLSAHDAARSQAGNFRHRREGLAVRLADDIDDGLWVPRKRVTPSRTDVTPERVEVVRARRRISAASHESFVEAKKRGSLDHYLDEMRPLIAEHDARSRAAALKGASSRGPAALALWVAKKVVSRIAGRVSRGKESHGAGERSYALFISLAGDFPNIGDAVIRRTALDWSRGARGRVTAYVGNAPTSWLSLLGLEPRDRILGGRLALARWVIAMALSKARPALVLEPGEVSLSRWNLPRQVVLLLASGIVRARGGRVLLPPRAVTRRQEAAPWRLTVIVHQLACRISEPVYWRDEQSIALIGRGTRTPDLAFAVPPEAGDPWESRDVLLVSLRGKRPAPSSEWAAGVREFARRRGLRIVTVAQVEGDESRAAMLAELLGGHHVPWYAEDWGRHEARLVELYRTSKLVISDRLHVLILASLRGASPFELVDAPSDKVRSHFGAIGVEHVSRDSAGLALAEVAAALDEALTQHEAIRAAVLEAGRELQLRRGEWRRVLSFEAGT